MSAARHRAWAGRGLTLVTAIGLAAGCGGGGGGGKAQPSMSGAAGDRASNAPTALKEEAPGKAAAPREVTPAETPPTTRPAGPDRPDFAAAPSHSSVESLAAEVARLKRELESQRHATTARADGDAAAPAPVPPPTTKGADHPSDPPAAAKHDAPAMARAQEPVTAEKSAAPDPSTAGANAAMSVDDWAKALEVEEKSPAAGGGSAARSDAKAATNHTTGAAAAPAAEQRIKDNPLDVAAHLEYQLAKFLRNEPVPDLAAMAKLPQEDRDILTALLDGLSNFRNGLRAGGNPLLAEKLRPLLDLAGRLRTQADLAIPTIALCTDVRGFGAYTPVEPARFESSHLDAKGRTVGPQFVVYCEIQNLASRQGGDGQWESQFTQQSVLYTEQGMVAWQSKRYPITDRARSRRHDFHSNAMVLLPPGELPVGRYVLKVTIEDDISHRVAEATTPVDIVTRTAQPAVATERPPAQPAAARDLLLRTREPNPPPPAPAAAAPQHGLIPFPSMIAPAPPPAGSAPVLPSPSK